MKTKFRLSLWLKQSKHTLGYGVKNIHEFTEQFVGEILQRQGSTRLQSKCCWSSDKEERMTVH